MNKKKPVFSETIKKTSLFILSFMALKFLGKLLFKFDTFVELKNQFVEFDQKTLIVFTFLVTIILGWVIVSLITGMIYFSIQKIKYHKTNKNK